MRQVFADSLYWIALSHPGDQWHAAALKASHALQRAEIVTTQEMLGELLTAFRYNPQLRAIAARRVLQITADPRIIVIPQSDHSFRKRTNRAQLVSGGGFADGLGSTKKWLRTK
jgi:hypothetical protein